MCPLAGQGGGAVADAGPLGPEPTPEAAWRWWLHRLTSLADSLRNALGIGVMRASGVRSGPVHAGGLLPARTVFESAKIEEAYSFEQVISQNPQQRRKKEPTGRIELSLPCDGDKFFTRQAYADVSRAFGHAHGSDRYLAGYLSLEGHGHTDVDSRLDVSHTYGSIPIVFDIPRTVGPPQPNHLIADRSRYVFSCDYKPGTGHLNTIPVRVDIDLLDPDSVGWSVADRPASGQTAAVPEGEAQTAEKAEEDIQVEEATEDEDTGTEAAGSDQEKFMQQVDFRRDLAVRMAVHVNVPGKVPGHDPRAREGKPATAKVAKVTLGWPTVTSLRDLTLTVDGALHWVRYNPTDACLEWSDVQMTLAADSSEGTQQTYVSKTMDLSVPYPGELYQHRTLRGSVEVELDKLLSGMDVRLFQANGFRQHKPGVELLTKISVDFTLILDEAFAKRVHTPYQRLHFDEVIPSSMRINDIKSALVNRGFSVRDPLQGPGPNDWWLEATRSEGPDTMTLVLYVAGTHHKAKREWKIPGGVTYRSHLDSGEIAIYAYGALARSSQPIVREINALRRALHDRFDHLPARR